jgi:hypothetical protein
LASDRPMIPGRRKMGMPLHCGIPIGISQR